jgi:hypothetical protein
MNFAQSLRRIATRAQSFTDRVELENAAYEAEKEARRKAWREEEIEMNSAENIGYSNAAMSHDQRFDEDYDTPQHVFAAYYQNVIDTAREYKVDEAVALKTYREHYAKLSDAVPYQRIAEQHARQRDEAMQQRDAYSDEVDTLVDQRNALRDELALLKGATVQSSPLSEYVDSVQTLSQEQSGDVDYVVLVSGHTLGINDDCITIHTANPMDDDSGSTEELVASLDIESNRVWSKRGWSSDVENELVDAHRTIANMREAIATLAQSTR